MTFADREDNPVARMREFIKGQGGEVRFDRFAREHLLGEQGFYSRTVDLSREHFPVRTPMDDSPEYRLAYARTVLLHAKLLAESSGQEQVKIVEIGPGGGELCGEVLDELQRSPDRYRPLVGVSYTGVDPNIRHVEALVRRGVNALVGTAQAIPLSNGSADIVVAEEVLDSLPYRLFEWNKRKMRIDGEAFVSLRKDSLELTFRRHEDSASTRIVEEHLKERRFGGRHYAYSEDYLQMWCEMYRILAAPGIALVSDYTIETPLASAMMVEPERDVLQHPYNKDLTHFVDVVHQMRTAAAVGFKPVAQMNTAEMFHNLGGREASLDVVSGSRMLLQATRQSQRTTAVASAENNGTEIKQRLMALDNGTPGCRRVLQLTYQHARAAEITAVLEKHGLSGGSLWALYSDKARENIDTFVKLVTEEDPEAIRYALRFRGQ
jgi:SAM-dependent MidA family methyltransferase